MESTAVRYIFCLDNIPPPILAKIIPQSLHHMLLIEAIVDKIIPARMNA
jgi:hypothetical protein